KDVATQAAAAPVTAGTNLTAQLDLAPTSLTGTVVDQNNQPIADACIDAYAGKDLNPLATGRTTTNGTWTITNVSSYANYQLRIRPCTGTGFTTEWWRDAPTRTTATTVTTSLQPLLATVTRPVTPITGATV